MFLSEIKAEAQYDGALPICLGFMKFVLLIFFLKLMYFFTAFFEWKYFTIWQTFNFKYHLLLINEPQKIVFETREKEEVSE